MLFFDLSTINDIKKLIVSSLIQSPDFNFKRSRRKIVIPKPSTHTWSNGNFSGVEYHIDSTTALCFDNKFTKITNLNLKQ